MTNHITSPALHQALLNGMIACLCQDNALPVRKTGNVLIESAINTEGLGGVDMVPIDILAYGLLFGGLFVLGVGYFYKGREKHLLRLAGWIIFGAYWLYIACIIFGLLEYGPSFAGEWIVPTRYPLPDVINLAFTGVTFPFFAYLGYHEYLSHKWNEEDETLKFIAGMSFFAGTAYYAIDTVPQIAALLIYAVALQTVWFLNATGFPASVSFNNMNYVGTQEEGIFLPIDGTHPTISIVLACTAIQAIVIFLAAIYCTKAERGRKIKGYLAALPLINFLNVVRNAGIVYLVDVSMLGLNFDFVHIYIGKTFSLIVLIFITFYIFKILPELHENIISLTDLPLRIKRRNKRLAGAAANAVKTVGTNINKDAPGLAEGDAADKTANAAGEKNGAKRRGGALESDKEKVL